MKKKTLLYSIILLVAVFGCVNDSEDDLIDNTPLPPPDLVNFEDDIKIIFDTNCLLCHGEVPQFGAQTSLVTYDDVVFGVENTNVIGRISLQPGEAGAMPLGGPRLPQNLIDLIILWQDEGFLESQN